MVVNFELNRKKFMGLNRGLMYKFSPATSYVVECETQEEIDLYCERLGKEGIYNQCGWLDDKFGVSWQIVPPKNIQPFMKMSKFNIETLFKRFG